MTQYLSVCSGIEAATVAWRPLGWRAKAVADVDSFANAVTAHHYPDVPNLGDLTKWHDWGRDVLADADILVGGTPCQAFSVAGLRGSLADDRGNLSLEFVRLADAIDDVRLAAGREPAIIVWENVPGVLSVRDNAFGCFLAGLSGEDTPFVPPRGKWTNAGVALGPARAVAWRTLDAQYFGLAQRRRRVFVVASARNGFDPAAVLLEWEGVRRDTPPRREAGKGTAHATAPCLTSSGRGVERTGDTRGQDPVVAVPHWRAGDQANSELLTDMAGTLNCNKDQQGGILFDVAHSLRGEGFDASDDGTGRGTPLVPVAFHPTQDPITSTDGTTHALGCGSKGGQASVAVAVPLLEVGKRTGVSTDDPRAGMGDIVNALNAQSGETGKGDAAPCVATINHGDHYADAAKAGPIEALRALRRAIGEEAFTVWGFGSLAAFQSPEILQSALHGCGLRPAAFSRSWLVHCALSRSQDGPGWLLQSLRETGCEGCPPQGWEPSEQLAGELGAYLSKLSQPGASAESVMRDLWLASEGPGVLQQALAAVQAVGRSVGRESQPTHATMAVRRLTATECEFLQGFPRNYTRIPWKKKSAEDCPDGPRYKALGNSMAVPVMRWIGQRIAAALEAA